METQRILITGSLGYIGTLLAPYLTNHHYNVIGYDTGFFQDCTLYPPEPQKTVFKDARHITPDDLQGIDAVVHLAGISNDPFGTLNAHDVYDPTLTYSLRMAQFCKDKNIRFIFASSCSIYGKTSDDILTEDSPTNPQTPYSLNKLQIEQGLTTLADKNFSPISLRFATAFGPSPRLRFDLYVNMFAGMILTTNKIILNSNGQAWRPNIHITDIIKAIKHAIDYNPKEPGHLILNVGDTRNNARVIDIAHMFIAAVPDAQLTFLNQQDQQTQKDLNLVKDQKIQDGVDKRTYKVSFDKITKTFKGYTCTWTMKDGIKDLLRTLENLNLTATDFNNINYYRLQKFDDLYKNHKLTKDLYWTKP
jgi:nucleoside-diphosphate-sugar epimerase